MEGPIKDVTKDWKKAILNLAGKIPGYNGYAQKEGMRDEDKLLRTYLANDLNRVKGRLLDMAIPLAEKDFEEPKEFEKVINIVYDIDKASQDFDRVIDKIRFAEYGYSGLFDSKEVNEPELQRLKEFDGALTSQISVCEESLIPLQDAIFNEEAVSEKLKAVGKSIMELERKFYDRDKVIKGVTK